MDQDEQPMVSMERSPGRICETNEYGRKGIFRGLERHVSHATWRAG